MKHNTNAHPVESQDVFKTWGMPGSPFQDVGDAYRAWFEGAQQVQAEAVEFMNERVGKDMAMLSDCARCTTVAEALEVQARYGSDAVNDYLAEGRRLFELLSHVAPVATTTEK